MEVELQAVALLTDVGKIRLEPLSKCNFNTCLSEAIIELHGCGCVYVFTYKFINHRGQPSKMSVKGEMELGHMFLSDADIIS